MKSGRLIILTAGAAILAYVLYRLYRSYRGRSYYTVTGGQWIISWAAPTGTEPISYSCVVSDSTGKQIINTSTTSTSIVLDPSLFVPSGEGVMSDEIYSAVITPFNSWGTGPDDKFTFQIYDTPGIVALQNYDSEDNIYPVSGGGDIFGVVYNNIVGVMILELSDRVAPSDLNVTITYKNQTYTPTSIIPQSPNANGEASQWILQWCKQTGGNGPCPVQQVTFTSGDTVSISVATKNPGGTFAWSADYTVPPPPPVPPGSIDATAHYVQA